ncbi:MAG: restriction endonuclease [Magnetococcales bacterium]|nr:restriction endonuclease [Magnetococcales bacterium]
MPKSRSYEAAFSILSDKLKYPEAPPVKPKDIEPPPPWTPWTPILGDPQFEPPLWTGWRSMFNEHVLAAYAGEIHKKQTALYRKFEIREACSERNKSVEDLAAKAERSFEKAAKKQQKSWLAASMAFAMNVEAWNKSLLEEQSRIKGLKAEAMASGEVGLIKRIELTMRSMSLPSFVSREYVTKFDSESGILIHEHRYPDPSGAEWIKHVELKSGWTEKPANQKEKKDAVARLHPTLCLRLAAEIARLDDEEIIKAITINGWADYTEKSTGQEKRAYCASLFATKEQIMGLNLSALDPLEAFAALKGIAARSLELTPIAPIVRLKTSDSRFVDPKEVISKMAEGENLAAMDWEDFEHLCRELFERAFASAGAEVKVTQASRDQGVDAIVFDHDPLRSGKIVIQAKRYTNTVDVSAVRDLYGAVMNEGAMKGILVTTSHFGSESYSFAKDKPITLINGHELLGLLEQHGYKFRINLAEAKKMLS